MRWWPCRPSPCLLPAPAPARPTRAPSRTRSGPRAPARSTPPATSSRSTNTISSKRSSIFVGAVRAQAQAVLDEPLVVGDAGQRAALRELQAHAAELRRRPVDHRRITRRIEIRRTEERRIGSVVDAPGVEAVVARAHAPGRHELVDALQ